MDEVRSYPPSFRVECPSQVLFSPCLVFRHLRQQSVPRYRFVSRMEVMIVPSLYAVGVFHGMYSFPSDSSSPFSRGSVLILALLLLVDRSARRWVSEDCIEAYYAGVRVEDSQAGMYFCFSVSPFSFLLRTNTISLPCPLA
jgi:hypothetical protein